MEQIRHAHLLIANKADLLSEDEMATVTMELSNFNGSAPIIQTTDAKVSFPFIEKVLNASKTGYRSADYFRKMAPLSSKLITFSESVNKEEFEEWVKSMPETVYR